MSSFTPKDGVHRGVPFWQYRGWDAINNSSLGAAKQSMLHYRMQEPLKDTPSLKLGRLVHEMALEPENALRNYVVLPDLTEGIKAKRPKATNEYKNRLAEFQELHEDKEIVTQEEYDQMVGCLRSLRSNARFREYMNGADYELSILWVDETSGLRCKARLDICKPGELIGDIKTTQDASAFEKSIANFDYHRQAAFYMDGAVAVGLDPKEFCFVPVEKTPPFGCRAAPMAGEAILVGREMYQSALQRIAEAEAADVWPSYQDPSVWHLPKWAMGVA
ncbi:MAG: PD-(D/E)XK nuclease-like domain-containing protein [Planctomycetota bacterium]